MDCWTVEFKYEDSLDEWASCGPVTADLEEAANWMGICSRIYTDMLVRIDNNSPTGYTPVFGHSYYGQFKTVKCMFRLHNTANDEIIPGEVFIPA